MKCLVLVLALVALVACEGEEPIKPGRQEQEDEVYLVQLLVSPAEAKDGGKGGIPDKTSPIVARLLTPDKNNRGRTRRSPRYKKGGYGGCNSCGGGGGGGGYPSGGGGFGGGGGSGSWSQASASASSGGWGNGYGGGKGNYGK